MSWLGAPAPTTRAATFPAWRGPTSASLPVGPAGRGAGGGAPAIRFGGRAMSGRAAGVVPGGIHDLSQDGHGIGRCARVGARCPATTGHDLDVIGAFGHKAV